MRRQSTGFVGQVEVLLMVLHRADQHFLGHHHKLRIDIAQHGSRQLDKTAHLIEQRLVDDDAAAASRRLPSQLALD